MFHAVFNYVEAGAWVTIAVLLFIASLRVERKRGRIGIIAAVSFLAFGVSDVVEAQTGAFWRPISLLALKALCVLSLALCGLAYLRLKRRSPSDET